MVKTHKETAGLYRPAAMLYQGQTTSKEEAFVNIPFR